MTAEVNPFATQAPPLAPGETARSARPLWVLIAVHGAANLVVLPLVVFTSYWNTSFNDWLAGVYFGALLAQIALLSAWLAWSRRPLMVRLLGFAAIGSGIFATWLLGYLASFAVTYLMNGPQRSFGSWQDWYFGLVAASLVTLAMQTPLWLLRWLLRLRIEAPAPKGGPTSKQVSIADLFALTTIVAVLLGLLRFMPPRDEPYFWPIALIVMAVLAVITLVTIPVAAWLMSLGRRLWIAVGWTAGYLVLLVALTTPLFGFITGGDTSLESFLLLVSWLLMFIAILIASLTAARLAGWRLVSEWRQTART